MSIMQDSIYTSPWQPLVSKVPCGLRTDFSLPAPPRGSVSHEFFYPNPSEVINQEWLDYMQSRGSRITSVIAFYRAAGSPSRMAHIDVNAKKYVTTCAINWVIGGEGSHMSWYDIPDGFSVDSTEITIAAGKTHYLGFEASTLREVSRCEIKGSPVLVRTNIPHQVFVSSHDRWSISMRFGGRYQTWESAVDDFLRTGDLQLKPSGQE